MQPTPQQEPEGTDAPSVSHPAVPPKSFDGHFPGAPAFPGVGQVDLAIRALTTTCRGIERVRFRSRVGPHDALELRVGAEGSAGSGRASFELLHGDAQVAAVGVLVCGALDGGQLAPAKAELSAAQDGSAGEGDAPIAIDLEAVLPHRGTSLFLESLSRFDPDRRSAWCVGRVPVDNFLVDPTRETVQVVSAVEFACQAGAVVPELSRPAGEPLRPLTGALASVKEARFHAADYPVGTPLHALVRAEPKGRFVRVIAEVFQSAGSAGLRRLADVDLNILVEG